MRKLEYDIDKKHVQEAIPFDVTVKVQGGNAKTARVIGRYLDWPLIRLEQRDIEISWTLARTMLENPTKTFGF